MPERLVLYSLKVRLLSWILFRKDIEVADVLDADVEFAVVTTFLAAQILVARHFEGPELDWHRRADELLVRRHLRRVAEAALSMMGCGVD